ncbi:MAG: hypothetical protein V4616_14110 [Bacteroidota bacterium]
MKDQNQNPGQDSKNQAGTGQFGQKNPQSSPTSGSTPGKSPAQSVNKDQQQKTPSYGQQTHGQYGQTPDAGKGSVAGKGSTHQGSTLSGQKEGRVPQNEKADDFQRNQQDKDLEKLTDPDKTKGPERGDIDPVAKQNKGLNTSE